MHILVIPSWFPNRFDSVYGVFFFEQVKAIQPKVEKIGVIVPSHSRGRNIDHFKRISTLGLSLSCDNYYGIQVWSENNYLRLSCHIWRYRNMVKRNRMRMVGNYIKINGVPDVIHAHSIFEGGVLALEIKKKYGIPLVVTEHFSGFVTDKEHSRRDEICRVIKTADHFFAVGTQLANNLKKFAPQTRIDVLGNIVDLDFFQIREPVDKRKVFRFCVIASLDPNKGVDLVIKALSLGLKGEDVELCIGGVGKEKEALRDLCDELGVATQVQFLGALDRTEVRSLIQNSDVLISSSYIETFGITILESLACGKPVIATRSGGPEDILNDDLGMLIPTGDVHSMIEAMLSMRTEAVGYDPYRLRNYAKDNFGKDAIVGKLLNVYRNVTGCNNIQG